MRVHPNVKTCMIISPALLLLFLGLAWGSDRVIDDVSLKLALNGIHISITGCVHNVTSSWDENTVTWNNMPSWESENMGSAGIEAIRYPWIAEIDLEASVIQEWVDDPSSNQGILCLNNGQISYDEYYGFFSRESEYAAPELLVSWHWEGKPVNEQSRFGSIMDSYVDQAFPNENYGSSEYLYGGYREGHGMRIALIKFELWPTTVEEPRLLSGEMPETYALSQNYPNPFNASTEIRYHIPEDGYLTLKIFNALGQEVRTLVDADHRSGEYTVNWDGQDNRGHEVASGLYFCRLRAGEFSKTIKMVLLK